MKFLKMLARWFCSLIFKLSLTFLVIVAPVVMVLGTAVPLKQALRTSKIYDSAVENIVKSSLEKSQDSASQAAVQAAAAQAITPTFLQNVSEQIIDSLYAWLDGKTAQPEFKIDISAAKQQFTQALGDYAVNRAKTLPVCTLAQARAALSQGKVDPLNTPCIPAGYDLNNLRSEIVSQISQSKEGSDNILQNSTITQSNLPKDDTGRTALQNLTDKFKRAPMIFHWLKLAPWLLSGSAIVFAGLVVLSHDDKRRGIRNLAWTLLPLGLLTLLSVFATRLAFGKLDSPSGPLAKQFQGALQQPVLALVHLLTNDFNNKLLIFGMVYTVLGGGTLIALRLTKPKSTVNPPADIPSEPPEKPESKQ